MTVREKLIEYLVGNMLWPKEAAEVMGAVEAAPENAAMAGRWNDGADAYPPQMLAVLAATANAAALAWMDAHCPKHFARKMFAVPL